jgi:hypothetical protein
VFASDTRPDTGTGERNFLPFIPWLAAHGKRIETVSGHSAVETVGVNTPDELVTIEAHLQKSGRALR